MEAERTSGGARSKGQIAVLANATIIHVATMLPTLSLTNMIEIMKFKINILQNSYTHLAKHYRL